MYTMSALTKSNVERVTGVTIEEMKRMTMNQERDLVKKRNGERLTFSKQRRFGIIGRGNPLLARRKFRTEEDLNIKSKRLMGV